MTWTCRECKRNFLNVTRCFLCNRYETRKSTKFVRPKEREQLEMKRKEKELLEKRFGFSIDDYEEFY